MPCSDTTAKIEVFLSLDDVLSDFDFAKLTCQKEIGGDTGFKEACKNRHINDLLKREFAEYLQELKLSDEESKFLLYLEWEALHTALSLYKGNAPGIDRYQIASIEYDVDGVKIVLVARPPKDMPKKIKACVVQATETK